MVSYEIDRQARIVSLIGPEFRDGQEFAEVLRAITSDPQFETGFGILRDRRHLGAPPTSIITRVAAIMALSTRVPHFRVAVVIRDDDAASYGMIRMAQMLNMRTGLEIEIFNDCGSARSWLQSNNASESEAVYRLVGEVGEFDWVVEWRRVPPEAIGLENKDPRYEWWLVSPAPARELRDVEQWDGIRDHNLWHARVRRAVAAVLGVPP
jgi:hypothetical protein